MFNHYLSIKNLNKYIVNDIINIILQHMVDFYREPLDTMSTDIKNMIDNDYLVKANQLIIEWKSDLVNSINEIFFDTAKPKASNFENVLSNIQTQIEKVIRIPIEKRKFEF